MQRRIARTLALGGTAVLLAAGLASGATRATTFTLSARLTAGQEFPKQVVKVPGARGAFSGTLTKHGSGAKLTFKLTFSHLSAPAFAAHIHLGKPGVAGNVIVPLCAPCKSGAHGTKTVSGAIARAIEAGKTYVNVHTVKNPAGEIRGQVKATA